VEVTRGYDLPRSRPSWERKRPACLSCETSRVAFIHTRQVGTFHSHLREAISLKIQDHCIRSQSVADDPDAIWVAA
jgi:hypothetical protein